MMMTTVGMAAALVLAPMLEGAPLPGKVKTDRTIELSVTLDQPPAEVYRLWTTVEGARTFFAPDARIEGKPGGRYEIIFDPAGDPEGARHGTKGARLLRLVPGKEIAFEWSMPPLGLDQQPLATWVELTLEPAPGRPGRTRLHFAHYGFRSGGNWDKALSIFRDGNWPLVLNRLVVYCRDKVSPAWKAEAAGDALDRILVKQQAVAAPVAEVWKAWTTEEGVKTFFAPAARVQAVPDGPFEIFFNPAAPEGEKGAEGSKVLAVTPMRLFAFDWGAPPTMPNVRKQRTNVIVQLEDAGPARTLVRFTSIGWGTGDEWVKAHAYFDKAWDYVLANLAKRFAEGPIDWNNKK
jgi:uncharacterized protein YndB with AHSA1/START domain